MKAKTIEQEIAAKMADFALSIKNEELSKDVEKYAVVTGGCIASMFLQEKVNDYDVYFSDFSTTFRVAVYYILESNNNYPMNIRLTYKSPEARNEGADLFQSLTGTEYDKKYDDDDDEGFWSKRLVLDGNPKFLNKGDIRAALAGVERVEVYVKSSGLAENDIPAAPQEELNDEDMHPEAGSDTEAKYRPVFLSSNAVTLSHKVQLVLRFVGDPKKIHESYDFVHATNYWTTDAGLVTNQEALEALLARELVYRGSLYPLASIFRTRKFIQRGWNIHIGNYVKMAMQLNKFDLFDHRVLEEQLTGVDALYLQGIISAIKERYENDPNFEFNAKYVCELCDRMIGLRKEVEEKESNAQ